MDVDVFLSSYQEKIPKNKLICENDMNRRMVRGGGRVARGAAATPPKFGQLSFVGQQEKIWAKPVFKDVSMVI